MVRSSLFVRETYRNHPKESIFVQFVQKCELIFCCVGAPFFFSFLRFVKVRSWQSYSKCQYSESGGKVEDGLSWCETHKWNGRVGS